MIAPSSYGVGRELPHDDEAEVALLSCCLIEDSDTLAKAVDVGITPDSFYVSDRGAAFAAMRELAAAGKPIEPQFLRQQLIASGEFERVGGLVFITSITQSQPTTLHERLWIKKVRDLEQRREVMVAASRTVAEGHEWSGDVSDFIAAAEMRMQAIGGRAPASSHEMTWDSLLNFSAAADADCLMGKRFISRTGSLVIVAPSGIGKSVLSLQLGACAALGRPFFGLQMAGTMRVLYVQAEDDLGDVSEAAQGFVREYGIAGADLVALRERLRIVRWNDAAGDKFLARLRREHARRPFDLAIINPLFSFCGCNVSEQRDMSAFLRNGLNPILNDTGAACVLVHHTNKPKDDDKAPRTDGDLSYLGSGSAELTNWARAYITLQQVKGAGSHVYKMAFAKRGRRAGIVDADGRPTTSVLIEHSPRGLCWLASDFAPNKGEGGKFASKFNLPRACQVYDAGNDWAANEQAIALDQNVSRKTVFRHRQNVLDTVA